MSKRRKTSLDIDENIAAFLAYLFGWISGLVILLLEKRSKFVRFHAMQSIVVFGSLQLLYLLSIPFFIVGFIMVLYPMIMIVSLILWILLMIKAYQYEWFKIPIAGDLAEKLLDRF